MESMKPITAWFSSLTHASMKLVSGDSSRLGGNIYECDTRKDCRKPSAVSGSAIHKPASSTIAEIVSSAFVLLKIIRD